MNHTATLDRPAPSLAEIANRPARVTEPNTRPEPGSVADILECLDYGHRIAQPGYHAGGVR